MKRSQSAVVLIAACLQLFSPTLARGENDVPPSTEKSDPNDGMNSSALVKKEMNRSPSGDEAMIQKRIDDAIAQVKTELSEQARMDMEQALLKQKEELAKDMTQTSVSTQSTSMAPRMKELSGAQFDLAFHNKAVTYNKSTGEVVFSGTTSPTCLDKFSFSKAEGSTEIMVKFTYRDKSELDCLDKKNIVCDEDHECVGLRSRSDSRVKLGTESGYVAIVYKDAYNQDVAASDRLKSKDGEIYHKGTAELAKDKADAAEKAKREKVAKLRKQAKEDLRTCRGDDEATVAIKREYLEELVAIGEKTEEEAEKISKKLDKKEMEALVKQLGKASLAKGEDDEFSDAESIKEKIATLAASGDEDLQMMANKAHLQLAQRLASDLTVHPLVAAQNAQEELAELASLDGLSEKEYEMIALQQMKLGTRISCLSGAANLAVPQNAIACQNVQMQIMQERMTAQRAAQPIFDANGKVNPNFMNGAQTMAMNGTDRSLAGMPSALGQQTPGTISFADFAQLQSPAGGVQFVPNATQPNANGSIMGSGYQLLQQADPRANLIR